MTPHDPLAGADVDALIAELLQPPSALEAALGSRLRPQRLPPTTQEATWTLPDRD